MKKSINVIFRMVLSILVFFSFVFSPLQVNAKDAETLGDLEDALNALIKEKNENDKKQQSTQEEIKRKQEQIDSSRAALSKAEEDYDAAEVKIEESNEKIAETKEETEKLLRFLQQMQGENAYVEYVTGASSMTELIMRLAAVEQITNHNQETMNNLEALIKENEQLKIELKQKQADLTNKISEYQATMKQLNIDLEEYDEFEVDIATKVKNAQESYNEAKKICSNNPNTAKLGRNAKLDDCYNTAYNAGWLKPLKSGVVTSTWGNRLHPTKGYYSFHNGIDIGGNPEGTPIYAAAAGRVTGIITKYSCGGNMVYIEVTVAGKKYTTWYYHLKEIYVKNGQSVTQNTVIGTVGGYSTSTAHGGYDTCTTGAHLHFGVETGWHGSSVVKSLVITAPGFNNAKGYRFNSRTDYYGN